VNAALQQLCDWQAGPLGRAVLAAEAQLLGSALDDVFGPALLQLGPWALGRELVAASRTRHQTVVASAAPHSGPQPQLIANPAFLPVPGGSVDAVLLPHCLEFEPDPQAVLREADRVLVAEGQLVVLGFRPLSAWGLRHATWGSGFPPGLARLLSERRLRDWLVLLGYEVAPARHYLYTLPRAPRPGGSLQGALRRGLFNPLPAGAYVVKARKRVYGLTPIRPRWRERERARLVGGLVNPTSSQS
jgi:SAM-dependent methyltransferase